MCILYVHPCYGYRCIVLNVYCIVVCCIVLCCMCCPIDALVCIIFVLRIHVNIKKDFLPILFTPHLLQISVKTMSSWWTSWYQSDCAYSDEVLLLYSSFSFRYLSETCEQSHCPIRVLSALYYL